MCKKHNHIKYNKQQQKKINKLNKMMTKLQFYSIYLLIVYFFKVILSKELLISEEFQKPQITSKEVIGWSKNIIRTCEQKNIVEYTGQIFGVFSQDVTLNKKTYKDLPPHWSALVRLDLMLYGSVDADEGDYAGISIDDNTMDRYTKNDQDGYLICSNSKAFGFWGRPFYDAIYPYQRNYTHNNKELTIKIDSKFTGTNTDTDYEGYAFKHVSVYVDTCYSSCQSCFGPSSNQCTACIPKAVEVDGVCTCPDQLFAYNFQCIQNCPYGFVGNPITRICEESKCLNNCGNCENFSCTKCNYPNKLISGECLSQCPSFSIDKGTYCEDKIIGLTYGGYVFKGLYSSNFGDSEIQGQGLRLLNFKNGGATFSSCSGERFIGGWNVAGSGSEIRRELPKFKPHWSIRIGFKYIMIDNWDKNEFLQVALDNNKIISNITKDSATKVGNICGNTNPEAKGVYDYNTTHISSSLTITIKSNLASSKSPFEASFGIRELFILVNYCQDNCLECNEKGCTKCPQGTYLYEYNCEISCPTDLGFWANGKTNTCDKCEGKCLTCDSSATSCLKCKPNSYLYQKSCSEKCPDGYAPNETTLTCDKCHQNCKTCTNPNDDKKCTSCEGSRFLSGNECLEQCPDGTYGEYNGNKCQPCNINCLTCKGKTNSDCLSCNTNKYYQPDDNTCGDKCKITQYKNGNNCTPCHETCYDCSAGTEKDCNSCSKASNRFLYEKQCLSQCPDQYYPDKTSQTCKQCHSTCFNCSGPNSDQCTKCSGDLYLNPGNKCLDSCPDGQFKNQANNTCESCDSNCVACIKAKNNCTKCNPKMFLDSDGVCKNSCPDGKWTNNSTRQCELCDPNCKTCDNVSKSNCKSCNSPLFLDLNSKKCVSPCPSKFYGNQSTQTCDKCEITCQECSGPNSNQCTKCSNDLYLDDNKCVKICSPGKFSNLSTNNCDPCDKMKCKECDGSSTNCTKCNSNLYLHHNTCLAICPKGYYANLSNGKCDPCNTSCETCFGPNPDQCTNCKGELLFDPVSKKCVEKCQQKYYEDKDNNQCVECDSSCLECSGSLSNQCTKCPDKLILFKNECISSCPDQYFQDPNAYNCIQCDSSCFNCKDNSPNSCTACKGNLYLTPKNQCLEDCPDGTYQDTLNNICKKCDISCLTCSGPDRTNCLKCPDSTYFEENQCKSECNQGWKNSTNNTCDECNIQCSKCNGPNENNCLECPNGTFLNPLENTCVTKCPTNYYPSNLNNKCLKCDTTCKECTDSGSDKCTECEGSLFLKDGKTCSSKCNDNEYGNELNNKCELCDKNCKTCTEKADQCTSCNSGTFLTEGKCEKNCPDSTFKNEKLNICDDCNIQCQTCFGPSNFECNSCKEGTYLDKSKNNCVSKCPIKQFGDSTSNTCKDCIENCDVCSDDKTCNQCSGGYFLHKGLCVSQCPTKFFNDISSQQCTKCAYTCLTCFDATEQGCYTCIPETFKNTDNNSCLYENECPSGRYPDTNTKKCEPCFSTCAECVGKSENQCVQCIQDRLLYKGECLKECPSNTFKFENKCIDCDPSCSTCFGSASFKCLTCSSGYLQEGSCVEQCETNYYPAIKNGQQVCLKCHDQCSKCNGPDSNNCTECDSQYFMYQNQCVENCPVFHTYDEKRVCQLCTKSIKNNKCVDQCDQNEYLEKKNLLCQPCAVECQTCNGPTKNDCKQCADGYFLDAQKSECTQNCPESFFSNKEKKICEACHPLCQTCSSSGNTNCLSCNSPLILFEGKCLKDAPDGYYTDKDKFKKCNEDCKTCDGPSSNDCLSCLEHHFILDKKCYKQCPSTYFNDESSMKCTKCSGLCKECQSTDYCLSCIDNQYTYQGTCQVSCDPILTFQDENLKQCIQCHFSCNKNGCLGPEQGDCINVGSSGFDSLIAKILIFKAGLWIFSSITGAYLDYKNGKSFGKFGQVRSSQKQLSIHVSDKQVRDIIRRERKDLDFQGTQLNLNQSPNRRKRTAITRASMISMLPTAFDQTSLKQSGYKDILDAESPTKKSTTNLSYVNIQSQLQILPFQNSQNDVNISPTSRSPYKISGNKINFADFKIRARPLRQSTLAKINEDIPTFQNVDEQLSSDKSQQQSIKDNDSDSQTYEKDTNKINYPKKLYYTLIGNEIISIITLYDPKKSRIFRSAMLFTKYLILFFMTYISQSTNYGVAALGLLAAIAGKGILQIVLSQFGLCLRKAGLLSLVFVSTLSGSDIYFWFIPKIQALSHNLDMKWSFTYILLFTSDFLIIQSLISLTSYIVTIRSKFVDNSKLSNKLLNIFFKQPALLQKAS
ncbi:zinc finger lsd1 subclass family protein (macronuclear) [Tetrahymena thermophila SB210]|uniref:Zinc finger lsd1 subclass family protein n=1 Tax=Tetrahymena thermophila (strain SB210) TaxID=312017 RepID=W7XIA1_TETTS|nr:zinc finger lsd1 subclass family protein [Tetrahymena thermophila SB210]EWS73119.1 zinc finger lsd1 subclass family protein [Tetrahymena thermophila SB210]|eukprot:XP_012654306.1 zinc finger lsd1 subclass family protein [Tetrahymena thermophila SB210]